MKGETFYQLSAPSNALMFALIAFPLVMTIWLDFLVLPRNISGIPKWESGGGCYP